MRRWPVVAAALLVVGGAVAVGVVLRPAAAGQEQATRKPPADVPPATSGQGVKIRFSDKPVPLPSFSVKDLDGQPLASAAWRGRTVVVNFWATWCGPCRAEIPMLVALQERYRDQVIVVGLSIDTGPPESVRGFVREVGINYPVAIVGRDVQEAFGGVPAVPSTFIVNPAGGIVQRHVGLLNPAITEHEVRSLSGLATEADVQVVQDLGQVLLANAAFATEIPGVDLSALSPALKERALQRLNTEKCTCGCGLTLAQCRVNDPSCTVSPPLAAKIVATIK